MGDTFSLIVRPSAINSNPPLQAELESNGTVHRYQTFYDALQAREWVDKMDRMGTVDLALVPMEDDADIDAKVVPAHESDVDELSVQMEDEGGIEDFLDDAF